MATICIEGMDCSGKSTVCKLLLDCNVVQGHRHRKLSSMTSMESFRKAKKNYAWDSLEVTQALVNAINYDIRHAEKDSAELLTIQESTLLFKGYAMLVAGGASENIIKEFDSIWDYYPRFDSYFYLTVNKKIRLQRLHKREMSGEPLSKNDRLILEDYNQFARTEDVLMNMLKNKYDASIIDTSYLSPKDISVLITQSIQCSTLTDRTTRKCA